MKTEGDDAPPADEPIQPVGPRPGSGEAPARRTRPSRRRQLRRRRAVAVILLLAVHRAAGGGVARRCSRTSGRQQPAKIAALKPATPRPVYLPSLVSLVPSRTTFPGTLAQPAVPDDG